MHVYLLRIETDKRQICNFGSSIDFFGKDFDGKFDICERLFFVKFFKVFISDIFRLQTSCHRFHKSWYHVSDVLVIWKDCFLFVGSKSLYHMWVFVKQVQSLTRLKRLMYGKNRRTYQSNDLFYLSYQY